MAAQLEEVVVDADALDAEHFAPDVGDHLLGRRARAARRPAAAPAARAPAARAGRPCRSGSAAARPARRRRGHHVVGQRSARANARRSAGGASSPVDDVGDEASLAARVFARHDHGLAHGRMSPQHRLDLAELDAEAADLHLVVERGRGTRACRPARQRARSPVRYSRAPGRRANGSARSARRSAPAGRGSRAPRRRRRCTARPARRRAPAASCASSDVDPRVGDRPADRHRAASPAVRLERR